ncbi:MAG: arginase [Bacteroidota bacterium]
MSETNQHIQLIINRSEITAGTRGASLGPDALMVAARNADSDFFGRFQSTEITNQNHLLDQETPYDFAKRIGGLLKVTKHLNEVVKLSLDEKKFPLVLAADHGSAAGTIAGIKSAFPNKRLGVVWIDAHADIHSPFTTPSGNMHGMPLAIVLNQDNLACQSNAVDAETKQLWEELKAIGGEGSKILTSDLVYVAVRDTEKQEDAILKELKIRNFTVEEVRTHGAKRIVQDAQKMLQECDLIYVSFDVDSMDPKLTSYGTGTPVENGLTPVEAKDLLNGFAADRRTCCIEFVEVNPCLDNNKNKMAECAFALIEEVAAVLNNRGIQ